MKVKNVSLEVFILSVSCIFIMLLFSCGIYFLKDEGTALEKEEKSRVSSQKEESGEEVFLILNEATNEVEEVTAMEYALGAVMAEMPPDFHIEALKAQSLSALTRARYLKKKYEDGKGSFPNCHFSQNPDFNQGFIREENASKIYKDNTDIYLNKMKEAANFAVSREITYEGEPILAAYHAMSAGFTEDCENVWDRKVPYLTKTESRGDTLAENFEGSVTVSYGDMKNILQKAFPEGSFQDGDEKNWIEPLIISKGGYVEKCLAGNAETDGKTIRKLLDLRSASFIIKADNGNFNITTKGYGHGVGLSQVGADFMARQGQTAEEIIEYYYKGAEVNLI